MSSQHNVTPGPIPPENNPPINPQYYQPRVFYISAITTGPTTTITTSTDHDYVIGQLVRLLIPELYGSRQLNEQQAYVISIPSSNQVTLDLYSVGVTAFVASPAFGPTRPQIVAIGDVNTGQINFGRTNNLTYIPGSFINISPN